MLNSLNWTEQLLNAYLKRSFNFKAAHQRREKNFLVFTNVGHWPYHFSESPWKRIINFKLWERVSCSRSMTISNVAQISIPTRLNSHRYPQYWAQLLSVQKVLKRVTQNALWIHLIMNLINSTSWHFKHVSSHSLVTLPLLFAETCFFSIIADSFHLFFISF